MSTALLLVGATDQQGCTVVVKTTPAATVRVAVSTAADMLSPVWSGPVTSDADGYAKLTVAGLPSGVRLYAAAETNAALDTAWVTSFRTHPVAPGQPCDGKILTSSCADSTPTPTNHPVFDAMRTGHPDSLIFLHQGDQNYADLANGTPAQYLAAQLGSWTGAARPKAFWQSTAVDWVWDDHDFGDDDSDRTSPGAGSNALAYRRGFPHPPLVKESGAIHHTYQVGRLRFILTDMRFFRDPINQGTDAERTLLGAEQKQWFKDQLLAAKADPGVACTVWIGSQVPFVAASPSATWGSYLAERAELWDFFAEHGIGEDHDFVILAGDIHASALVRESDHSTLGSAPPIPQMTASPLYHNTPGGAGHPWDAYVARSGAYGELTWTDDGDVMECTYRAHVADSATGDNVMWEHSWRIGPPPAGRYPLLDDDGQRVAVAALDRFTGESVRRAWVDVV